MKKRKTPPPTKKINIRELGHADVPASVGLVKEVREELRADIRSVDHKLEAVSDRLGSLEHKVDSLDKKIDAVEHRLESKIELVLVAVHRTQVLMEEQRGENRIVLDGIKNLFERQDRLEADMVSLQNTVKNLPARVS